MSTEILLESGTNELELMEFYIGGQSFGINISKILQIMTCMEVTAVPDAPPEVEGVFILRGQLISVINLSKVTGIDYTPGPKDIFIICEFNQMQVAFHVSRVSGINRISWSDISVPPNDDGLYALATGTTECSGHEIIILDFEKIVSKINRSAGLDTSSADNIRITEAGMKKKRILVADDSKFLNQLICESLEKIGFTNIVSFSDGQDAWDFIQSNINKDEDIRSQVSCVISDIEMPKMDGHHFTKLMKSDEKYKEIPIILFSSLINEQMIEKGKAVGADAQFSKPQMSDLIAYLIGILA